MFILPMAVKKLQNKTSGYRESCNIIANNGTFT